MQCPPGGGDLAGCWMSGCGSESGEQSPEPGRAVTAGTNPGNPVTTALSSRGKRVVSLERFADGSMPCAGRTGVEA